MLPEERLVVLVNLPGNIVVLLPAQRRKVSGPELAFLLEIGGRFLPEPFSFGGKGVLLMCGPEHAEAALVLRVIQQVSCPVTAVMAEINGLVSRRRGSYGMAGELVHIVNSAGAVKVGINGLPGSSSIAGGVCREGKEH
jgi:hypothetical protein